MAEEKTLKQSNLIYLGSFTLSNIIVFLLLIKVDVRGILGILELDMMKAINKIVENAFGGSLISGLLCILVALLSGLISSDLKHKLIFLRWKDVLPGCSAFSKHMHEDSRIDPAIIEENHGTLPVEPSKQNSLWYRIYKKYQNEPSVIGAHKNFLLMRELYGIQLICLVGLGVAGYFLIEDKNQYVIYLSVMVATLILLILAARNYGVRFVTNVLALETCSKKESIAVTP